MRFLFLLLAGLLLLGCTASPQQAPAQPGTSPAESGASGQTAPPIETYPPAETSQPAGQPSEPAPQEPVTSLKHQEFTYSSGIWTVHGTIYASQNAAPKKAIILVPMLGEDRYSYPISLIEKLHSSFPDALVVAIDPRGHGESDNAGSWESFDQDGFRDMKTDILNIKKNLKSGYPVLSDLYVVGASIGSTSAINAAAQDGSIIKLVMLSPGMEYRGVDITRSMEDYIHPLLVVASSGDSYSMQSVDDIESIASMPQFEKKIYSGSAHGTDMFASTAGTSDSLENVIVEFLK